MGGGEQPKKDWWVEVSSQRKIDGWRWTAKERLMCGVEQPKKDWCVEVNSQRKVYGWKWTAKERLMGGGEQPKKDWWVEVNSQRKIDVWRWTAKERLMCGGIHYLINGTIFEKKVMERNMSVLTSTATLSETFLIVRRTERDAIRPI